ALTAGVREPGRQARNAALGRRAPAHRARARLPAECPDPHSRRADELGRSAHRSRDPGSTGGADARPYGLCDHAPCKRAHDVRHEAASGAGASRAGHAVAAASAKMSRKRPAAVLSGNLGWPLLEDIRAERYTPTDRAQLALAGHWVGLMHTAAARVPAARGFPEGGPPRYLDHLRADLQTIRANLANPALTAGDAATLGRL